MDLTNEFIKAGKAVYAARERAGVKGIIKDDGKEYCSKCGEPLMLDIHFDGPMAERLGAVRHVPRNCECMREMFAREEEEEKRKKFLQNLEVTRYNSILSEKWREMRFDKDKGWNPKVRRMCDTYISKWEDMIEGNYGLAFVGAIEGGKTFWASCLANALVESGATVLMTTVSQLISEMTEGYNENRVDVMRRIKEVQFLILDDVGAERESDFVLEKTLEIIDTRGNAMKPLIITSNIRAEAWTNPPDVRYARIYSRLGELCPAVIKMEGKYRQDIAQKKRQELSKLLKGE